jgi:hypothetical protein
MGQGGAIPPILGIGVVLTFDFPGILGAQAISAVILDMHRNARIYIVSPDAFPDGNPGDFARAQNDVWVAAVHEIAKLILEHAETLWERSEAINKALFLGMPLNEIEEYLDWLAMVRREGHKPPGAEPSKEP